MGSNKPEEGTKGTAGVDSHQCGPEGQLINLHDAALNCKHKPPVRHSYTEAATEARKDHELTAGACTISPKTLESFFAREKRPFEGCSNGWKLISIRQ